MPARDGVPATRVISPSPTPSERSDKQTQASKRTISSPPQILEENDPSGSDSSVDKRARTRSRSPVSKSPTLQRRRMTGSAPEPTAKAEAPSNGHIPSNGHLSPYTSLQDRWRDISRSPSPLGLIPLHRRYRSFIHRHEIPRKLLHVSIGFITLDLYRRGVQKNQITPWLFSALLPIAATDFLRHRFQAVNKLYIRCLGALMRETEVSGYNGVIWYLLGAFIVLQFFPKDVGVMGVLLLSWCDTAASTFGRLYGRYTVRIRRGKSLAGTLGAWAVGVITAAAFWGYFVPAIGSFPNDAPDAFMFTGTLHLIPSFARNLIDGIPEMLSDNATVNGPLALGIVSLWTGFVAAGSELIDFFGWDDNLTIPVLSGVGMWGFLKVFGS